MVSDELKPCPFCGEIAGAAIGLDFNREDDKYLAVICQYCNIHTGYAETSDEAAKLWNTRPLEDALQATIGAQQRRVERLEAALKRFADSDNYDLDGDWLWSIHGSPIDVAKRALEPRP